MVSSSSTGVSGKVNHAPRVLGPLRGIIQLHIQTYMQLCSVFHTLVVFHAGPLPSASGGARAKPSSVQKPKRKTPLYRMKMLLDLKKVAESNNEPEKLPHIPTLKEWVRQEKRKEKEEKKKEKKALKNREKQLKKELKQEQKTTGNYYNDIILLL